MNRNPLKNDIVRRMIVVAASENVPLTACATPDTEFLCERAAASGADSDVVLGLCLLLLSGGHS